MLQGPGYGCRSPHAPHLRNRRGILSHGFGGDAFNSAAESFYREQLKKEQMGEAIDLWCEALRHLDGMSAWRDGTYNQALLSISKGKDASAYVKFLQVMGLNMFLRTGRSQVTGAGIRFHVNQDRI